MNEMTASTGGRTPGQADGGTKAGAGAGSGISVRIATNGRGRRRLAGGASYEVRLPASCSDVALELNNVSRSGRGRAAK